MTAHATALVWWIFATFGIAGIVAFWFLAPTAAQLTLQFVARLFKLLLGYRIGCALLAAIVAGLIVDYQRHAYDDEQFAKRTAAFEAAQTARDTRIAQETRDRVWTEIANAKAENKATDNDVKEFTDALPAFPFPTSTPAARPATNPFLVGADAGRLCHIAGKTECGPTGDKGVSAARRPGGRSGDKQKIRLPSLIRSGTWTDKQGQ